MTTRLVMWLAIAACLQVGTIALLYWPGSEPDAATAEHGAALLPLPREAIAHIGVTDTSGNSVDLDRRNNHWFIDDEALPAAAPVVARLLDALTRPTGFPVARSNSARERFEVDGTRFQRRITFESRSNTPDSDAGDGNATTTIYLGTSPGMRRVHARRGDSAAILAIALSTFDVPATVDGWLDPALLATGEFDRVQTGGSEWIKSGNTWAVSGTDRAVDAAEGEALKGLAQALDTVQVTGVAAADSAASAAQSAEHEWRLWQSGKADTWQLASGADGAGARIYRSDFDRWFTLGSYDYDRLVRALNVLTAVQAGGDIAD
ncbi:MAG: DUF4340 domain-containing protein [Chromatocurvus sp.]